MEVEEVYDARADAARAQELANIQNPFHIEVRFLGGLTEEQKQAFRTAADTWASFIRGRSGDRLEGAVTTAVVAPHERCAIADRGP